jgi:hypothetical protein
MKNTFTREEVTNILVSALMFSSANNNQGLSKVKGETFGEQAETIIKANEAIEGTNKSMLSVLPAFV